MLRIARNSPDHAPKDTNQDVLTSFTQPCYFTIVWEINLVLSIDKEGRSSANFKPQEYVQCEATKQISSFLTNKFAENRFHTSNWKVMDKF